MKTKSKENTKMESLEDEYRAALEDWCQKNGKNDFYEFFQFSLDEAKRSAAKHKRNTWSAILIAAMVVATIVAPFAFSILTVCIAALQKIPTGTQFAILAVLSVIYFGSSSFLQWRNLKKPKETWVRHSARYNRLFIILAAFALSNKQSEDYEKLVTDTFAVLQQNLDQFVLNLSSYGLAQKPKS